MEIAIGMYMTLLSDDGQLRDSNTKFSTVFTEDSEVSIVFGRLILESLQFRKYAYCISTRAPPHVDGIYLSHTNYQPSHGTDLLTTLLEHLGDSGSRSGVELARPRLFEPVPMRALHPA
jgi:hypothetical protein